MAWDAPCRGADALGHHFLGVDQVASNNSHKTSHTQDAETNMYTQLSPVDEEHRVLAVDAPLQVTVTVRFRDPTVRSVYSRAYSSSQSFLPSERLCRGLLRRIDHCSEEFITRKDSDALNSTQCYRKGPKQLRFELAFDVHRRGYPSAWARRVFRSYQKHALTGASANDVLRSTHSIVGLFLKRHDQDFDLTEEPAHDYFPDKPETFTPSRGGPLDLTCVPRSLLIESTQNWEFVPGYSLELTFKSSNPARYRSEIRRTSKVDSSQATPLNLGLSEDLLWQAYRSVQDLLDQKKNNFDLEHADCDGFDGVADCDCQHFDENALDVELRIVNNLGPVYEHLHRNIQSRIRLFSHPLGQDCDEFVSKISSRFHQFTDRTDKKIEKLNDLDFRIAELTGHGWHEKNCARFTINGKESHSRGTIEALLDRVRTGVGDVLRGHDVAIRMIAYKRGHLILDKALIARDHQPVPPPDTLESPEVQQRMFVAQLKARIQKDIDMVCKDTCNLDEVPEVAPPSPKRALQSVRPLTPCQPLTPRTSASQLSQWVPPGSPANFTTRPPTPPEVPPRKSSRVFPLVPAKYKEQKERSTSEATAAQDSGIGADFDGDDRTFASVTNVRVPPVIHESREDTLVPSLRPAAEVYPASKAADYDTDSISTHSSMPALTESDTPSPEQSMLITPSCVRSSSPSARALPFYDVSNAHHLSSPLMLMDTSAPSSSTFSEVKRFAAPKAAQPRPSVIQRGPPETPRRADAEDSVPVNTPKAPVDSSGDEKTPLAHRQMHGPTGSNTLRDSTPEIGTERLAPQDSSSVTNGPNLHDSASTRNRVEPETKDAAAGIESSEAVRSGLPTEGFLLCYVEEEVPLSDEPHESPEVVDAAVAVAQGDPPETLPPSTFMKQRSIDDVAGLQNGGPDPAQSKTKTSHDEAGKDEAETCNTEPGPANETSDVPRQVTQKPEVSEVVVKALSSVPTEEPERTSWAGSSNALRAMTMEDELCRSKLDFFEQDEDSAIDSEPVRCWPPVGDTTHPEVETQPMGMSERPEMAYHVIPFSDSGIDVRTGSEATEMSGSESDQQHLLSPIDENASELDVVEPVLQGETELAGAERETASEPLGNECVRLGDKIIPVITNSSSSVVAQAPESPGDDSETVERVSVGDPRLTAESISLPKARTSAPNFGASRSFSNPHPSSVPLGLGNNHLLPPLPVFPSFTSKDIPIAATRASWSSSSSWEDYVSTARQSSDSVDTIKPSPSGSGSDVDDGPDTPKRLGTPTAGLLGLHESRWAEFGIRTALTGTHAFDRPSTAPTPESPERSRNEMKVRDEPDGRGENTPETHARLSPSHQTFHLRQKKSIGSVIFSGNLHKKESKELRKKESKDPKKHEKVVNARSKPAAGETAAKHDDEGAGRFPRAMMFVAGLAFASSVVNRNHS